MSKRSFDEVNKEYALKCAQLGELEYKASVLKDQLTDLANDKEGIKKAIRKLAIEAQSLQASAPLEKIDPATVVPSEQEPE